MKVQIMWECCLAAMTDDCKSSGCVLRWFESNHSHQNIVSWRNWQTHSRICESGCRYVKFGWIFIISRWSCRFESGRYNVLYTAVSPSGKASDFDSDSIYALRWFKSSHGNSIGPIVYRLGRQVFNLKRLRFNSGWDHLKPHVDILCVLCLQHVSFI